jgi:hypothetical protein
MGATVFIPCLQYLVAIVAQQLPDGIQFYQRVKVRTAALRMAVQVGWRPDPEQPACQTGIARVQLRRFDRALIEVVQARPATR